MNGRERHPYQLHSIRWPDLDNVIVGGDPTRQMPKIGTIVKIDGVDYEVLEASPIQQYRLKVRRPTNG